MTLTIKITQLHIDLAAAGTRVCPVEQALRASGFSNPCVEQDILFLNPAEFVHLSSDVRAWLAAFDAGRPVKPITLKIKQYPHTASIAPRPGFFERLIAA